MDERMQEVGLRLLVLRKRARMSQTALAKKAGVSQKQLSLLEAGKAPGVKATTLRNLAQVLGTSTDYLLGLVESPIPGPRPTRRGEPVASAVG